MDTDKYVIWKKKVKNGDKIKLKKTRKREMDTCKYVNCKKKSKE